MCLFILGINKWGSFTHHVFNFSSVHDIKVCIYVKEKHNNSGNNWMQAFDLCFSHVFVVWDRYMFSQSSVAVGEVGGVEGCPHSLPKIYIHGCDSKLQSHYKLHHCSESFDIDQRSQFWISYVCCTAFFYGDDSLTCNTLLSFLWTYKGIYIKHITKTCIKEWLMSTVWCFTSSGKFLSSDGFCMLCSDCRIGENKL